jgi:sec-independent protein translocase protein TatB
MFDFGFSEVLLTSVIALIVLGPEKLPRAASQVGRWVGRARAMARQFREQLEEEVNLENVKKAHKEEQAKRESEAAKAPAGATGQGAGARPETTGTGTAGTGTVAGATDSAGAGAADSTGARVADSAPAGAEPHVSSTQPNDTQAATDAPLGSQISPDPSEFRADTFSHAHPTDEFGANPLTGNGAAEVTSAPAMADTSGGRVGSSASYPSGSESASSLTAAESAPPAAPAAAVGSATSNTAAPSSGAPAVAESAASTQSAPSATAAGPAHGPDANEAYASSTASAPEQAYIGTTSPTDVEKSGHS